VGSSRIRRFGSQAEARASVQALILALLGSLQNWCDLFSAFTVAIGREHQHYEIITHAGGGANFTHAIAMDGIKDWATEPDEEL
jgi:hypothetical protein